MDNGHWFWHSAFMNAVEKGLLNLTHWIWAKRHNSTELESVPVAAPVETPKVEPAVAEKKPARKPATKKAPKGNEWSVK